MEPRVTALMCGIVLIFLLHALYYNGLIDDAFISFRYARNFAEGLGLVFNPGERVEGYTNFLWVLMMSAVVKAGGDPTVWSRALGIVSGIGSLLAIHIASRRAWPDRPVAALAGPLFLACNRTFCAWSTGGLETALFSFLCLLGILVSTGRSRGQVLLGGTLLGLAALTRPEGALVFAALALVLLLDSLSTLGGAGTGADPGGQGAGGRAIPPIARLALVSAPFLLILAAELAFRHSYYGRWQPNSFAIKVSGLYPASGLIHLALFARDNLLGPEILGITVAAAFLLRRAIADPWRLPLAGCFAAAVIYLVYIVMVGGDHFEYRFFHPVLVLLAFPFAAGTARVSEFFAGAAGELSDSRAGTQLRSTARRAGAVLAVLAGVKGLVVSAAAFETVNRKVDMGFQKAEIGITSVEYEQKLCRVWSAVGRYFGANADPSETIALGNMGAIPYYSRLRTFDILGLTDPEGANFPYDQRGVVGHQRRADQASVMRRGPTYYSTYPEKVTLPGPDTVRLVTFDVPDEAVAFHCQSVSPTARIQPGRYTAR